MFDKMPAEVTPYPFGLSNVTAAIMYEKHKISVRFFALLLQLKANKIRIEKGIEVSEYIKDHDTIIAVLWISFVIA